MRKSDLDWDLEGDNQIVEYMIKKNQELTYPDLIYYIVFGSVDFV